MSSVIVGVMDSWVSSYWQNYSGGQANNGAHDERQFDIQRSFVLGSTLSLYRIVDNGGINVG